MSQRALPVRLHPRAKLTPDDVRWVRANLRVPIKVAAHRLRVHPKTVQAIRSGRSWTWLLDDLQ